MRRTNRPRCMALTKAGDQCENRAANGSDYCGAHGTRAGRHTKLTPIVVTALEAVARKGIHRNRMAELVDVDPRTFYRWLEAGAADEEAGTTSIYVELRQRLTRAEAEAEESIAAAITRAAIGVRFTDEETGEDASYPADWRAGAWFLERRYPDRWGAKQTVEHSGAVRTGELEAVTPSDDAAAQVARILARAGAVSVPPTTDEEDPDAPDVD